MQALGGPAKALRLAPGEGGVERGVALLLVEAVAQGREDDSQGLQERSVGRPDPGLARHHPRGKLLPAGRHRPDHQAVSHLVVGGVGPEGHLLRGLGPRPTALGLHLAPGEGGAAHAHPAYARVGGKVALVDHVLVPGLRALLGHHHRHAPGAPRILARAAVGGDAEALQDSGECGL